VYLEDEIAILEDKLEECRENQPEPEMIQPDPCDDGVPF
jgi:hypothetical protein